jgi:hypothetical protein
MSDAGALRRCDRREIDDATSATGDSCGLCGFQLLDGGRKSVQLAQ